MKKIEQTINFLKSFSILRETAHHNHQQHHQRMEYNHREGESES